MVKLTKLFSIISVIFLIGCGDAKFGLDNLGSLGNGGGLGDNSGFNSCAEAIDAGALKTYTYRYTFPANTNACDWNKNGNLSQDDGKVVARNRQDHTIDYPAGARICDLNLGADSSNSTNNNNFQYDDNLLINLNDHVLATNADFLFHHFNQADIIDGTDTATAYEYEWLPIRNHNNGSDSKYCLGSDENLGGSCTIPGTDIGSNLDLSFNKSHLTEIVNRRNSSPVVSVIITGDNDNTDCKHSGLDLDFTVSYY